MSDSPFPNQLAPTLLSGDELPAFTVLNGESTRPVLFLCDHASNAIPKSLGSLGLGSAELADHIAWDIGAAALTRLLADRFEACAVLTNYSRLVVDCNRPPGEPTAIPPVSDGVPVPGNQDLPEAEAVRRTEELFWPYHHEITGRLAHLWRQGRPPVVICIHSCAPTMDGFHRPWHIGLMYDHDDRVTKGMLTALARLRPDAVLGENQPYSGKDIGFTINTHAEPAGLPNLGVEFRQDLVRTAEGVADLGGLFGDALEDVLSVEALYTCLMA
ncbi:MAG: N-formylglutamate amidohydrolase [Rhodospirillum sp.]|nr:N-formylglutamate amidohydrolase [Rhodospirillum sp.]MCF8488317.1 N-formylglutamate amidohydrolase [Rhodospirillum sp.]